MPARDNATLPDFELPRIDYGERMFTLVYDRPIFFASGHPFTKVARISYGKFDQSPSPNEPAVDEGTGGVGFNVCSIEEGGLSVACHRGPREQMVREMRCEE